MRAVYHVPSLCIFTHRCPSCTVSPSILLSDSQFSGLYGCLIVQCRFAIFCLFPLGSTSPRNHVVLSHLLSFVELDLSPWSLEDTHHLLFTFFTVGSLQRILFELSLQKLWAVTLYSQLSRDFLG